MLLLSISAMNSADMSIISSDLCQDEQCFLYLLVVLFS